MPIAKMGEAFGIDGMNEPIARIEMMASTRFSADKRREALVRVASLVMSGSFEIRAGSENCLLAWSVSNFTPVQCWANREHQKAGRLSWQWISYGSDKINLLGTEALAKWLAEQQDSTNEIQAQANPLVMANDLSRMIGIG